MKAKKTSYLTALLLSFTCFTQTNDNNEPSQILSLAELAAKKVGESLEIDSPAYEQRIPEIKQRILIQKGTLNQILNFIKTYDSVDQDLIFTIPDKLWNALFDGTMTIQGFDKQVKDFSPAEKRWLTGALTEKVLALLYPDEITTYRFSPRLTAARSSAEQRLPLDYEIIEDEQLNKRFLRHNIKLIYQFEYLLSLYIFKKLEKQILDNISIIYERNLYRPARDITGSVRPFAYDSYIDFKVSKNSDIQSKLKSIFDQLIIFSDKYPEFNRSIYKLNMIFQDLLKHRFEKPSVWKFKRDLATNELVGL